MVPYFSEELLINILYGLMAMFVFLLLLILVQRRYGSVNSLIGRWTMSDFRRESVKAKKKEMASSKMDNNLGVVEDKVKKPYKFGTKLNFLFLKKKTKVVDPVLQKMKAIYGV